MVAQSNQSIFGNSNHLGMHGMIIRISHLDRLESAGTHMQCHLGRLYPLGTQAIKHLIGEMQTSSRCCYGTFDARIDGLIGGLVAILGFTIEVWRNRQFTNGIEDLSKADIQIGYAC